MRIMVVSDTHGECSRVFDAYKKLSLEAPVDMIIHCGDYYKDSKLISARLGARVYGVPGNCDGSYSREDFHTIETECGKLLVVHGHLQNVGFSMESLYYFAEEQDCIAAIFGHTHRSAFTQYGKIYLFNPGSISRPRDGSGGSFGLIVTDYDGLWGKVYDFKTFMDDDMPQQKTSESSKRKAVQTGKLREMINYSDRF